MTLTGGFRPGDVVRTYRWSTSHPWDGKVLAISSDGQTLALVDLGITLPQPEYPPGAHVVRAVDVDEVYLLRRAGRDKKGNG